MAGRVRAKIEANTTDRVLFSLLAALFGPTIILLIMKEVGHPVASFEPFGFRIFVLFLIILGFVGWTNWLLDFVYRNSLMNRMRELERFVHTISRSNLQDVLDAVLEREAANCDQASRELIAFQKKGLEGTDIGLVYDSDEERIGNSFDSKSFELTRSFKEKQDGFYRIYDLIESFAKNFFINLRGRSFKAYLLEKPNDGKKRVPLDAHLIEDKDGVWWLEVITNLKSNRPSNEQFGKMIDEFSFYRDHFLNLILSHSMSSGDEGKKVIQFRIYDGPDIPGGPEEMAQVAAFKPTKVGAQ